MVRGKKKATSPLVEKRAKKQKNAKGAKSKEGPRSTAVTSHWQSPHLLPPVLLDQPIPLEQRFVSEAAFKRYELLSTFNFQKEKGLSVELLKVVPEINHELRRRKWEKFNQILMKVEGKQGNASLAREFLANAYAERELPRIPVRGKQVPWSPAALNKLLGTKNLDSCPLVEKREGLKTASEAEKEEVKNAVCRQGTPWFNSDKSTKMLLSNFKPVAHAWAEFFVKSIEATSNSSEYQLRNAATVQMIIEGEDLDLGQLLHRSLHYKACSKERIITLGHCNLITAMCDAEHVPHYASDEKLQAIKALTVGQYRDYGKKRSHTVEADGDDNEGDSADEMNQLEDGTHLQQQQPQPHHDDDDIAALSTQLAIAEACNIPHVFYSEESTRYQAAKARLASFQHLPTYPTYPTRESLIAYHGIETAQLVARQEARLVD
ncbi:uncharacterized protein LOC123920351 isoform X1 [Trifolium pratense]|uniref:uncharacterized protein LOC123920351 isoform X1 n=1 Tax=Trifolium pratense TaxID=57577 RepID=UPI001E693F11|nr:uncharacterized protein LOC123920351 isoform X1 [Trifolium pratense]